MSQKYKYPRTYHVPWSPGTTSDDRLLKSVDQFVGKRVVVTEKMDGENTTMSKDYVHARSLDSMYHPSRDYVRTVRGNISHMIPDNSLRICGENCFAAHSITYTQLEDHFLAFSVWIDTTCLSWDDTVDWCEHLGLKTVPVLYRGEWNEELVKSLYVHKREPDLMEGYVIRVEESFTYDDFAMSVAKYVRKDHVSTSSHWLEQAIVVNGCKPSTPKT